MVKGNVQEADVKEICSQIQMTRILKEINNKIIPPLVNVYIADFLIEIEKLL